MVVSVQRSSRAAAITSWNRCHPRVTSPHHSLPSVTAFRSSTAAQSGLVRSHDGPRRDIGPHSTSLRGWQKVYLLRCAVLAPSATAPTMSRMPTSGRAGASSASPYMDGRRRRWRRRRARWQGWRQDLVTMVFRVTPTWLAWAGVCGRSDLNARAADGYGCIAKATSADRTFPRHRRRGGVSAATLPQPWTPRSIPPTTRERESPEGSPTVKAGLDRRRHRTKFDPSDSSRAARCRPPGVGIECGRWPRPTGGREPRR